MNALLYLAADIPDGIPEIGVGATVLATIIWFLRKLVDGTLENQKEQTSAMREVAAALSGLTGAVRQHMSDNERNADAILNKIQCPRT